MARKAFGKWKILGTIGEGGQAQVYRVVDTTGQTPGQFALKPLRNSADETLRKRFEQEVSATLAIGHRNILRIYESELATDRPYYVAEYCEGKSLNKAKAGRFFGDMRRATEVLLPVIDGLVAAHERRVYHRDLKPAKIQEDPYRFLIAAEKFQTGYDEPLLHTMYVDKLLSGIKAVQTLSRLNRARPQKYDTFVLDFMNDADTIQKAFEPYYRTTILSKETDPNKVHDLKAALDGYQVYSREQVEQLVSMYLQGVKRDQLDPILDACVGVYKENLDEDGQVDFKGKAKAFVRTYSFLASILLYSIAQWEVLSIFLNFLIPKLPAPKEEDLAKGILETVDMDSYRVEVRASLEIALPDENGEVEPVPTSGGGRKAEPELDLLSNIIKDFNDQFGNIEWKDVDKIRKLIAEEIPAKVSADKAYQNAIKNSDRQNARIEHDKALERVVVDLLTDHMELFKQFSENPSFKKWLRDSNFNLTYQPEAR